MNDHDASHSTPDDPPHVLLVADNVSAQFGGEAFLPLQYFTRLTERGVPTWMVCHERVRDELEKYLGERIDHVTFVPDTRFDRAMWRLGQRMPYKASAVTTQVAMQLETQVRVRRTVRTLVRRHSISVVHQPTPVSPKQPSALWGLGAPVVIGPMNGGMTFPAGLRDRQARLERIALAVTRAAASVANVLVPGKRRAALLLVANQRTKAALPRSVRRTEVRQLVENGVDLERFRQADSDDPSPTPGPDQPLRLCYVGALLDWKGVDILIDAVARVVADSTSVELEIFGDGEMRPGLERHVEAAGLQTTIKFRGYLAQDLVARELRRAQVLVLPSLSECGGAVVLEAMASGLPVIATAWGGPLDYLDEHSGVLIAPQSRNQMVTDIATTIRELHDDPERRDALSEGALRRAQLFDWERNIDRMLETYRGTSART